MPCSNLRFLVVEDHDFQRDALIQMLRSLGASTVYGANDGNAALQIVHDSDRPIHIVISDLMMPGMDGVEFLRHLGESGERVSLVLTSALDKELLLSIRAMADAYKLNILGAISKPVTAAKLAPIIELYRRGEHDLENSNARFSLDELARSWANDEFEPWFEPVIDLRSGIVRGMTAVPRWKHPEDGLLDAASFMPSVRARGLNDDMVWLMLKKCAAACRSWHGLGHRLTVTVNAGFTSLTDVNLASRIERIVQAEGLEPRFMVLGVPEAGLNTDQGRVLESLARIRIAGFGLAIDDFGSGLMASEQLSRVAFTQLRIKPAFVAEADADEAARAGLAVALDLAGLLHLETVAGNIGSKHEWNLLYEWGCDLGQGPFISAPLASDKIPGWLSRWQVERGRQVA